MPHTPPIEVLKFGSEHCMPCRVYKKTFERVTEAMQVPAQEIDIDEQPALKEQYGIQKIPTTVLLVDGREVARHEGAMLYRDLTAMIQHAEGAQQ